MSNIPSTKNVFNVMLLC